MAPLDSSMMADSPVDIEPTVRFGKAYHVHLDILRWLEPQAIEPILPLHSQFPRSFPVSNMGHRQDPAWDQSYLYPYNASTDEQNSQYSGSDTYSNSYPTSQAATSSPPGSYNTMPYSSHHLNQIFYSQSGYPSYTYSTPYPTASQAPQYEPDHQSQPQQSFQSQSQYTHYNTASAATHTQSSVYGYYPHSSYSTYTGAQHSSHADDRRSSEPSTSEAGGDQSPASTKSARKRKVWTCTKPDCSSTAEFGRKADLDRHNATVHEKRNRFPCPVSSCDRVQRPFTRKDHLIEHLRAFHGEDIPKRRHSNHASYEI